MFYWLAHHAQQYWHPLRVFQYITFRSIFAALTALLISLASGPAVIKRLLSLQIGQQVRNDGPQSHLAKQGTPTMGGVLILLAIVISTLLWSDWSDHYVWVVLFVTLGFGAVGWVDDYRKLVLRNSKGLSARRKLFFQSVIAGITAIYLYLVATDPVQTQLIIPLCKHCAMNLGWFFPVLAYFVIVGSSNAVNLTDGLDGLAIMPTVLIAGALVVFAYVTGNKVHAQYLMIPFVPGVGEVAVFCSAIAGAGLGFLWFNSYPAQVFMGDVGSLGIGAALGIVAVVVRQEIIYMLMGGIFVIETLSVIMQVGYYKMTGKRFFRMAPIHHHFELKGWAEPKVIVRFWIITVILVLIGLATLKLR